MNDLYDYRVRQLEYLLQIGRALSARLDLQPVLSLVITYAVDLLAGTSGMIALTDEEDGELRVRAFAGLDREQLPAFAPLLELPPHEIPRRGNTLLRDVAASTGLPLRQMIALPMVVGEVTIGLIYVFRAALNVGFSANDRQVLQLFADQAALAVSNARLYQGVVREKQRLDAIIEQSADGVMIVDGRWRIVRFNRAMEQLTGWTREEALGRPCAEVLAIHDSQGRNICLVDCPLQRRPLSTNPIVEGAITTRDGRELYIQSRYAPQIGPNGMFLGAIANVRDITAKRREEELQTTFISVMSHELKTPVSIIKGYAGTLRREDASFGPEVTREGLAVIEDEADRLARQIQDLLDVSRVMAGGLRLDLHDLSLPQLAADVVRAFAPPLAERFTFELRFPDDMPLVEADGERLRMALTNLVSNAIKYSPEGGTIRIGGRAEGGMAVCYVADQGIGIAPEDQERIFERFYRVDNRLRRETQGSGLGLFLTRAIIEAHGGKIRVESHVGRGSRLIFSLPLAPRLLSDQERPSDGA